MGKTRTMWWWLQGASGCLFEVQTRGYDFIYDTSLVDNG